MGGHVIRVQGLEGGGGHKGAGVGLGEGVACHKGCRGPRRGGGTRKGKRISTGELGGQRGRGDGHQRVTAKVGDDWITVIHGFAWMMMMIGGPRGRGGGSRDL